jgi:hypothetical protein
MFVEEAPKHGFEVNDKKIKEVLDDENVRHVSFEYTGENNLEDIAHPPGGFYLGSITVTNLDKGKEQRKELFKAFVSRDSH